MSWLSKIGIRRAEPRSRTLASIADSLSILAKAARVHTLRTYNVDLSDPDPSRADFEREIWEPTHANNEREAIREEVERLQAEQAEFEASQGPISSSKAGRESQIREIGLSFSRGRGRDSTFGAPEGAYRPNSTVDEPLTPQERDFLREMGELPLDDVPIDGQESE